MGEVYRETFGSALDLGRDALRELGFGAYRAQRAAQRFRRHDVAMLREMAGRRHEIEAMDEYISLTRQRLADVESTLRADLEKEWGAGGGWDTESLRRELGGEDG